MTTNDELQAAREAWAQRLSGYKAYEQRNFVSGYVQGCIDAAIDNIAALEARAAAQQQRIDELERLNRRANSLLGSCWSLLVHVQHNEGLYRQARPEIEQTVKELEAWNVAQHEALRAKGA